MKHEINSQNTKMMLAETLLSLLEKKPISKITVSELVNLCEINRKTFYYHFADVYDLLEWHLDNEIQKAMSTLDPLENFNTTISYSMEYMKNNTYLRNCIDNPLGRDKVVQFLNQNLYPKCFEMINMLEQRYEKSMEEDFKTFLVKSLTHITVLSIIDGIENPQGYDIERMKLYLSDVFEASVDGFFQRL
ncbi:MAG: hypothetical protein IJZ23_05655 [Roseburia sp.]|nr:hypothetical protein [Roseburia sp.]